MTTGYCSNCGAARGVGANCANCGAAYDQVAAPSGRGIEPSLAQGLITVQNLQAKLIVGRLIGLAAGLLIWWFVLGPALRGNFLGTIVAFFVLAFAGTFIGGRLVLEMIAGR